MGSSPGGQGRSSRIWPGAEADEGLRLDEDGLGAQTGDELGGAAEQQVADEDGGAVVVLGVDARYPPAHLGLVHDVVVVERGEVDQLHPGAGRDDLLAGAVAELRGEQRQQRAESLAARLDQVAGRLGDEGVLVVDRGEDEVVDTAQVALEARGEVRAGARDRENGWCGGHPTIIPAIGRLTGRSATCPWSPVSG